ncbi:MAG TPA: serine/threonine-protein kinase [Polyangiaceae bacterium]|jgi:serine/threonine-protein kinase|nr:serine/threonine-protein kinase [Polyangiaceae bacterium]
MSDRLRPGDVFAERYRIERFIAKGGFGVVYAAEQVDTEAKVALKIIWSHVLESDGALEQFKQEARLASRVGSEHVPRVFDVGRDPYTERPFLAMEFLEGVHFEELVRTGGPLPPATLVEYFSQIGRTLDRAHGYVDRDGVRRPIVHRDLKPENLFLTRRDDGAPLVKILDFGLAKMVGSAATLSHDLKGTPLFMAFEQASVGPVTPQTDIWALGLIAFYLLTGRFYWLAGNSPDSPFTRIFTEVLSAPLEVPSVRARALSAPIIPSADFDEWFTRCVNRDSSKRFETAGECVKELAAALAGQPVPAIATTMASVAPGPIPSLAPEPMATVQSLPPSSVLGLLPESTLARRRSFGRRTASVVFAAMLLLLSAAGLVASQRPRAVAAAPGPVATAFVPATTSDEKRVEPPRAVAMTTVSVALDAGSVHTVALDKRRAHRAKAAKPAEPAVAETALAPAVVPPLPAAPPPQDPYDHR